MKLQDLKDVILSQREEIEEKFKREKIIKREINTKKLRNFLTHPNILAILGVRRCGKSILSLQIFEHNYAYINFDDERLIGLDASELNKILEVFYEIYGTKLEKIILDEPQRIKGWELFANRLRRTKRVIITGSNSQLLSGELATALTGRHLSFQLFPFSFREYLAYKNFKVDASRLHSLKIAQLKKILTDFMNYGGFPEVNLFGREILVRIYGDILEKDIVRRLKIRKNVAFKEFAKYLISNSANEFTVRKIGKIIEVKDVHTLKKWLDAIEEAFLGFVVLRYSNKLKEQLIAPKKFYSIDIGLLNAISFEISKNIGRLMENLVAIELLRRKSYWHPNWEVFYWKDYQQREVDFVIKQGLKVKQLIQVTYASSIDEVEKRELRSLVKASELLKCKNLLVTTWDLEDSIEFKNKTIRFTPLWKWLLKT